MPDEILDEPDSGPRDAKSPFRPLSVHRYPTSERLKQLTERLAVEVDEAQYLAGSRTRRRREEDRGRFLDIIRVLVCDLIYRHLTNPLGQISVNLRTGLVRPSRYAPPAMGKQFPSVVKTMNGLGLLNLTTGSGKERQITTISAGPKLVALVAAQGIAKGDIGGTLDAEVIILREKKRTPKDKPGLLEYEDTDQTRLLRSELSEFNAFLEAADISVTEGVDVNVMSRRLCRRFVQDFNWGGRAFGGFWMSMKKAERKAILINGEPTVTLDYGQIAIRILYAEAKRAVPMLDVYAVPGLEGCRDGVKKLLNAMTFKDGPITAYPKQTKHLFPEKMTARQAATLITQYHPLIAHLFFTEIGYRLQRIESDIMMHVVRWLMEFGIVALPIHDAFMVQQRHKDILNKIMLDSFMKATGYDINVREE